MDTTARGLYDEYSNYIEASDQSGARGRLLRNHDYYIGTDHRQWDPELVEYYRSQGRTITTFNLLQGLVDRMLGHLEQEPIGPTFAPIGGQNGTPKRSPITQAWEADESLGGWEQKFLDYRRDALIHTGILRMVVDRSKDHLGRIDFELVNPKNQVRDPYFVTRDVRDCRGWFFWSWMTAEQIKSYYNTKSDEVDEAIRAYTTTDQSPNIRLRDASPDFWDEDAEQYKVIEFLYQEDEVRNVVIDSRTGQPFDAFPMDDLDGMSEEVADLYVTGVNPDLMVVRETVSITKTKTIVPGLSFELVLEEGEFPLQLGHLPVYSLSYRETYDDQQGVMDSLIDLQDIFNKRHNMVSHALGGSVGASNIVFEESAFGGDDDMEKEFQENMTENGRLLKVKAGTIAERRYMELQRPPMPLDVLRSVDEIQTLMFTLAGITPAMDGYSDRTDESGRLYQQKVRQAMVALEYFAQTYWHKLELMAEDYALAFRQVYAGVARKLVNKRTGEVLELNRMVMGPDGAFRVDEVTKMPAHFVTIEQKRTGKSRQDDEAQRAAALLPVIKNPLLSAELEAKTVAGMASDETERSRVDMANQAWQQMQAMQMQAAMRPPAPPQQAAPQGAPQGAPPA